MAYTAIKQMREKNARIFGGDVGPALPERHYDTIDFSLKAMALKFLHTRCEGLNFSAESDDGNYRGTSLKPNQIPYNMQMDINRLCLERELEKFIDSGVAEDAYTIYYCYLEMFFGHYGKSKKMVELLSEFEANGSSLLMKHRDHYSHSVYVFALGLAVYESNEAYREMFKTFYGLDDDHKAACCFLEYWGLTSLFHDIGYPFELPFEQVLSYYEVAGEKRGDGPYLAYRAVDTMTKLGDAAKAKFKEIYGRDFATTEELFAYGITEKLGKVYDFSEEYMLDKIHNKPINPDIFGYFMDHAYFSSVRLYRELENSIGIEKINEKHVDALTAILLHNSMFKFAISFYKDKEKHKEPLRMEVHPLAFMLMLCDELQCWDRIAYGRNSRTEFHPMGAEFDFKGNAIHAVYYYDSDEQPKIDEFRVRYRQWEDGGEQGDAPRLKAYSDMAEKEQRFASDIEKIVDTTDIPLTVVPATREVDRKSKHTYLSSSNFLHLYDFAVALNARYAYQGDEGGVVTSDLEKSFEELSLEYQLSNINQAKSFSKYLDAIGCFYTDRPVDYDMITEFSDEQIAVFAPMEHERWVKEHISMAWTKGDLYDGKDKAVREQLRMHTLAMDGNPAKEEIKAHYDALPLEEKRKDYEPFNSMLKLIKKFDGLRIYRLGD
ncbi:MAG: hypothetical protein K5836_01690 [Clostridiales bacterium]|nr:hypothetical protein [Clostridiales bacterium]